MEGEIIMSDNAGKDCPYTKQITTNSVHIEGIHKKLDKIDDKLETLNNGGLKEIIAEQNQQLINSFVEQHESDNKLSETKWKKLSVIIGVIGAVLTWCARTGTWPF